MNEAFLHYIWQHQYFDKTNLVTTTGEVISILQPGTKNTDAGPDFFNGKIQIGEVCWNGNVEIHINSSDWIEHKHQNDSAYNNVVLHVVWKENQIILMRDKSRLPTLELKGKVSETLLMQYRKFINHPQTVPCASYLPNISPLKKLSMLERMVVERLEVKSRVIGDILTKNKNDWDQTTYQLLCKNFGFKVNSITFERLAELLPYKILIKHGDQQLQVESLLFGQAGFLDQAKIDSYFMLLKREYGILGKKYNLSEARLSNLQWKFLRLRPANFPTIRIAQLAALLCAQKNIFSRIVSANSYNDLLTLFTVTQSDYWRKHYQFDTPVHEEISGIGEMSVLNIIINTAVPLMVAYAKLKDDQSLMDRAIEILQHIPAEDNAIIKNWKNLGFNPTSSADTQALLQLFNNYCTKRRCLECTIGFSIIQKSTE